MSKNHVVIEGNLGKDPEITQTANGKQVANFSLATTDGKEEFRKTEWHNVVAWGKTIADLQGSKKGDRVEVEGKITYRNYTNKEGVKVYITEILAWQIYTGSELTDRLEREAGKKATA